MRLRTYVVLMVIGIILLCLISSNPIQEFSWPDVSRTVIALSMVIISGLRVSRWHEQNPIGVEDDEPWDY